MNYNEFKKTTLKHLSEYKVTILKIKEDYKFKNKMYTHILQKENIDKNFFSHVKIPNDIKLHMYANHLNSSQVMCINFFEPLIRDEIGKVLLLNILEKCGVISVEEIDTVEEAVFEKIIDNREKTNFDFYLRLSNGKQIFFEIKYTENGFGRINKNVERYRKKWNNIYISHLSKSVFLKQIDESEFYDNYQIWRNISYIQNISDFVIFLFPFENESVFNEITNIMSNNKYNRNVKILDWKYLVDTALQVSKGTNYYNGFKIFKNKYLDFFKYQ